jgi:hypothetical protein
MWGMNHTHSLLNLVFLKWSLLKYIDPPVFIRQRIFVKIKTDQLLCQMLAVFPISYLAESFRHLGSLDPHQRRRKEDWEYIASNDTTGGMMENVWCV